MIEYIQYFPPELDLPFVIQMTGNSFCDGTYRIKRQKSTVTVIEYIIAGKGVVQENDQSCIAEAGDVYLLHQGCRHDYYSDANEPWTKIWFNVRGPVVNQLLQAYQLHHINLIKHVPSVIIDLFHEFQTLARSSQVYSESFAECALVFHRILIHLAAQIEVAHAKLPDEVKKIQSYIRSHICDKISLNDIARSIYRSKAYTIRIFKSATGKSPYSWLIELRLDAARQLLSETRLSVKSISEQLRFADQQYFSTIFRQATHLSPRQYRKFNQ